MKKRILIVEDEKNIVDILRFNLQREGYETLEAYDGEKGLQLALEEEPSLILLDVMLPKLDGFEVCRAIRAQGHTTPILMLTAREEETDKVLGLELGADDYITKPFSMRELLARIRRLVANGKGSAVKIGDIEVDLDKKTVLKSGEPVELTALEYRIFSMLVQNAGKTVTRELILERIWDLAGNYVNDNTLTVYIRRIRKKLGSDCIKTVKGLGYRLEDV